MPIYSYKCPKCNSIIKLFHTEDKVCACGCKKIKRLRSLPSSPKNTECVDKDRGTHAEEDIQKDLKKRSHRHFLGTLKETIDEHGEQIAKEKGWIKEDGSLKTELDEK